MSKRIKKVKHRPGVNSIVCSECDGPLDEHRYHLGYEQCVKCSDVEKYSGHMVYPHKTGGYVQPVKSDTKDNLKRLDRRSTGSSKPAKGIWKDNSWDRWLDNYYKSLNKPKKKKVVWKAPIVNYISTNDASKMVCDYYIKWGYDRSVEYCNDLYRREKISMVSKSKLISMLTDYQMLPKSIRKKLLT